MTYEIDQSIKIENTNKTTYVCLANGKTIVASLASKEKHILKEYFRSIEKPLIFKLFSFSCLCAEAISLCPLDTVTIDREYMGHERQIKSFILQILRIKSEKEPSINFGQIGKHATAHIGAYTAKGKSIPSTKLTASGILRYYEKINKK